MGFLNSFGLMQTDNGKCLEENPKNSRKGHRAKSEKHTKKKPVNDLNLQGKQSRTAPWCLHVSC